MSPTTASPGETETDIVRAAYAAYGEGDLEALLALASPGIHVFQTDLVPWGGHYIGLEEAARFFAALTSHLESRVDVTQMVHAGERVAVVGRTRGTVRATGAYFDIPVVHVWTVRSGRITAVQLYVDTPAMLDALAGTGQGGLRLSA